MKTTQTLFGILSIAFGLSAGTAQAGFSLSTTSGAYVVIPNNASLNITNNMLTVECWFNCSVPSSTWASLVSKLPSSTTFSAGWDLRLGGLLPRGSIYINPPNNGSGPAIWDIAGNGQQTANEWHHYAMQYDGTNYLVWMDGNLNYSTNIVAQIEVGSNPIHIGCQNSGWRLFTGWIAEVRISKSARYNRPFIPQIRFAADPNTIALYHFDEGQGTTVADSSGNGNNGTIQGTGAWSSIVASQNSLTNGLVAYYPFNGNANDASGNGSNGVGFDVSYAQNRFGVAGAAASFNGSSSFAYVTNFFSSQPTQITYSIWFQTANRVTVTNAQFYLAGATGYVLDLGWDCGVGLNNPNPLPDNGPVIGAYNGFGMYKYVDWANYYYCDITNFVFTSDQWHHVVAVYSGSAMSLYLDGSFRNTIQHPSSTQGLHSLEIGAHSWGNGSGIGDQYSGLIDDVRVYFRALSSNEVQQLYAYESTPPENTLTNGLVAYYPFNGNANDESGNGNNGTVVGATLTTNHLGKADSAYAFNGSNTYIRVTAPNLPFGNDPRTIAGWIKVDQNPTRDMNFVASWGYGNWLPADSWKSGFGLAIHNDSADLVAWCAFGVTLPTAYYAFRTNTYYAVAATYDGNGTCELFVNGLRFGQQYVGELNTFTNNHLLHIG